MFMKESEKKKSKTRAIAKIILAIALIIIYLGINARQTKQAKLKEQCTESVMGICNEVTSKSKNRDVHKKRRNNKSYKTQEKYTEYTSSITYVVNGKDYNAQNVKDDKPYPKEGEKIEIFYDPNDPSIYYIP